MAKEKFSLADAMRGTIGDASVASMAVSNSDTPVKMIPLARLAPNKRNFYPLPSPDELTELESSIEANGLLEPLTVVYDETIDNYRIISGHSRYRALRFLHDKDHDVHTWDNIPCFVLPAMSEAQELSAVIEANRQRVKSSAVLAEEARRLTEAYTARKEAGEELPGRIRDRVADALKVSATKLATINAIKNNLRVPGFQRAWKEETINDSAAYEISKMSHENQYRLLDWCLDYRISYGDLTAYQIKRFDVMFTCTKRECPKADGKKQCENAERMYRDKYRNGEWLCAGCCCVCASRDYCSTVCAYCKPEKTVETDVVAKNAALDDPRADFRFAHEHFCARLKSRREATGMDRKQFAESIDEYPNTYSAWENASLPGSDRLTKIALCLGVSLDYLFGLTDDPTPPGEAKAADAAPQWRTGTPEKEGRYWCSFMDPLIHLQTKWLAYWSGCLWYREEGGEELKGGVLAWYPLPEE